MDRNNGNIINNSPEYIFKKIFGKFKYEEYNNFFLVFFTGIIVNLSQFIYQGGNGDTNVYTIYQPDYTWECTLGRWMIQYVGKLRHNVVIPVFIEIFAIAILSIALILIFQQLRIFTKFYIFLGSCLFFASPFISVMLHIYYCSDAYAISVLFAVLAAWFLLQFEKRSKYILSIICMVISLSLYQSCIVITGILVLIQLLREYLDVEKGIMSCIRKNVLFLLTGVMGIVAYLLSLKWYLAIKGLVLADYKGMNSIGEMDFQQSCANLKLLLESMYFDSEYSVIAGWINGKTGVAINIGIVLCGILYVVYKIIKERKKMSALRIMLITVCVAFLPVMWGIVVFMAPQAAIGELLMPQLSFIYLFMLSLIASTGKLKKSICQMGRWLGIAACIYVGFSYSLAVAEFQYGLKLADNKAYALATEINSRLESLPNWEQGMKIAVVGKADTWSQEPSYYGINGKDRVSFWEGYGSQGCWQKYLLERIGVYYTICSREEYTELIAQQGLINMECFPKQGSVSTVGDTVVVKLGNEGQ